MGVGSEYIQGGDSKIFLKVAPSTPFIEIAFFEGFRIILAISELFGLNFCNKVSKDKVVFGQ